MRELIDEVFAAAFGDEGPTAAATPRRRLPPTAI